MQNTESILGGTTTVEATCLSSDKVLGGGYESTPGTIILADKPDGDNGWLVIFERPSSNAPKFVTVEAICATVTP